MRFRLTKIFLLLPVLIAGSRAAAEVELSVAPTHRIHTEVIKGSKAEFTIDAAGRTSPVNRSIELIGPAEDVRIKVEGCLDFSSIEALVKSLTRPLMTDEEKVKACFYFAVNNFYDRVGSGCDDPLEYVNLWGFSYCGEFGLTLNALWKAAGFNAVFLNPVTLGLPSGHTLSAVYYDNQWHLYDSRLRGYFLNRDNKTVASLIELDRDDNLIRRAVDFTGGMNNSHWSYTTVFLQFFNAQSDWLDGFNAHFDNLTLFNSNCPRWDPRLDLRENEKLTLNWTNQGKWWSRKDLSPRWKELHPGSESVWETVPPIIYANGTLEFNVDPSQLKEQAQDFSGIRAKGGKSPVFQPSAAGKTGYVVYKVRVPYFIPSMSVQAKGYRKNKDDILSVEISTDEGKSWLPLWKAESTGEAIIDLSSDQTQAVTMYSPNKYSYLLRFSLEASKSASDVTLGDIRIVTDLFYRAMSLPSLKQGKNRVVYSDRSMGRHKRELTFNWLEDTNILLSDDRPCDGDEVTLTGLVKNNGNTPASHVVVRFFNGDPAAGGEKIGEDQVIPLIEPGGTGQAQVKWRAVQRQIDASKGFTLSPQKEIRGYGYTHNTLYLQADPEDRLAETDKTNNITSRELIVYNMANLILYHPSFITFDRRGDKVRVSAMVRNQNLYGLLPRAREARNVVVSFFDGQPVRPRRSRSYNIDNLIGETVIPSIAPGEFGTAKVEWDVKGLSGRHLVYVVVDMEDQIPEIWQNGRRTWMPIKKEIVF